MASDERVLISTTGNGTTTITNILLLYDPTPNFPAPLTSLAVASAAPAAPTFPAPSSRAHLSAHRVFVYQASSGTVLRARTTAMACW